MVDEQNSSAEIHSQQAHLRTQPFDILKSSLPLIKHAFKISMYSQALIEETVGREIFRLAQHPPHTRFDTMGGVFDQYKELLGTLSPCDMVHLSSRSRYVCYPFKPEMCSKFVKYTMNL